MCKFEKSKNNACIFILFRYVCITGKNESKESKRKKMNFLNNIFFLFRDGKKLLPQGEQWRKL